MHLSSALDITQSFCSSFGFENGSNMDLTLLLPHFQNPCVLTPKPVLPLYEGFLAAALLHFRPHKPLLGGTVLCIVGYLATFWPLPTRYQQSHPSSDNQKCLQTFPNVSWMGLGVKNHPQLRIIVLYHNALAAFSQIHSS